MAQGREGAQADNWMILLFLRLVGYQGIGEVKTEKGRWAVTTPMGMKWRIKIGVVIRAMERPSQGNRPGY